MIFCFLVFWSFRYPIKAFIGLVIMVYHITKKRRYPLLFVRRLRCRIPLELNETKFNTHVRMIKVKRKVCGEDINILACTLRDTLIAYSSAFTLSLPLNSNLKFPTFQSFNRQSINDAFLYVVSNHYLQLRRCKYTYFCFKTNKNE